MVRLSLLDLAQGLAHETDPGAAVDYAEQAVEITAAMAGQNSTSENLVELANRLDVLSAALDAVGNHEGAARASRRAVATARQFVESNPPRHLPDLARYFDILGYRLSSADHSAEATVAWQAAETLYRGLISRNLSAYRPILARVLINLSNQVGAGPARALVLSQEAVAILRGLDEPDYPPDLVEALVSLRRASALLGRMEEAVAAGAEAVALARELVRSDPSTYRSWLAVALMSHGEGLADIGREREAIEAVREAVGIYAELAEQSTERTPAQGVALSGLAIMATLTGRLGFVQEARDAWHAVVDGYRQLAAKDPGYLSVLAQAITEKAVAEEELRGEGGDLVE
jgi:tetratricopeptide (TPR) repeat protein